eukprot:scaffold83581_cov36-Phaeocystis_antarctica.AAC.1
MEGDGSSRGAAWSKLPGLAQPPLRPPAAPEAHPLAQGCLPLRGEPSPLGCRKRGSDGVHAGTGAAHAGRAARAAGEPREERRGQAADAREPPAGAIVSIAIASIASESRLQARRRRGLGPLGLRVTITGRRR